MFYVTWFLIDLFYFMYISRSSVRWHMVRFKYGLRCQAEFVMILYYPHSERNTIVYRVSKVQSITVCFFRKLLSYQYFQVACANFVTLSCVSFHNNFETEFEINDRNQFEFLWNVCLHRKKFRKWKSNFICQWWDILYWPQHITEFTITKWWTNRSCHNKRVRPFIYDSFCFQFHW